MNTFQFSVFLAILIFKVQLTSVCMGVCALACKFSGGLAAFCFPFCMSICLAGKKSCFSFDTTIQVQRNDTIKETLIYNVKENDKVLTLKNGKFIFTKVVQITKTEGNFTFYELSAKNLKGKIKKIKLTENHGVIIIKNRTKYIIRAKNIEKGNIVLTNEGIFRIYNVYKMIENEKYTLYTEDGTVLASNIYVSTICEPDIEESTPFEKLMKFWRKAHEKYNQYV